MNSVSNVLKNAAIKCGLSRVRYSEKDLPDDMSKIVVMVLFPDLRSSCAASALLLKRYREEIKGSKYFILVSWPGFGSLFPFANEYWELSNEDLLRGIGQSVKGLTNDSENLIPIRRHLNWFFEDVLSEHDLLPYYDSGLTQNFWDRFKHVKRFLPVVPSVAMLGEQFSKELASRKGLKVFFYPSLEVESWENGHCVPMRTTNEFWYYLARELVLFDMVPVVCQNNFSHNISSDLTNQAIFLNNLDVMSMLAAMRASDCVLDVFNGISRFSMLARAPYLAIDNRNRYNLLKEWEFKGLVCEKSLPKDYIFSFSTILKLGLPLWKTSLFDIIIKRLKFFEGLSRDDWPTTSESVEIVPYKEVQQKQTIRLSPKFIRVASKNEI